MASLAGCMPVTAVTIGTQLAGMLAFSRITVVFHLLALPIISINKILPRRICWVLQAVVAIVEASEVLVVVRRAVAGRAALVEVGLTEGTLAALEHRTIF